MRVPFAYGKASKDGHYLVILAAVQRVATELESVGDRAGEDLVRRGVRLIEERRRLTHA